MLAQVPHGYLSAGELDAIDTALLSGTDAHHLAVLRVGDRVGLGVLDCDRGHNEVPHGFGGHVFVRGADVRGDSLRGDECGVSGLRKGSPVDFAVLHSWRREVRGGLKGNELSALLACQDRQGFGLKAWSDDAIGHFFLEDLGRGYVHHVADCGEVAEGAHGVRLAGAEVRQSQGGDGARVWNLVSQGLFSGQRHRHGGACRRHVLERSRCRESEGLLEFADELVGVESVQQVDVARGAVCHGERKISAERT
mmetsp:Transcript_10153/g.28972  ORF Transcript_10153/g.28972 Transcript_10153/m.28972 type:complete len:252 (+) Transcript_10153:703-1458(+)